MRKNKFIVLLLCGLVLTSCDTINTTTSINKDTTSNEGNTTATSTNEEVKISYNDFVAKMEENSLVAQQASRVEATTSVLSNMLPTEQILGRNESYWLKNGLFFAKTSYNEGDSEVISINATKVVSVAGTDYYYTFSDNNSNY